MMAKPMKTLKLHYPMIQLLIKEDIRSRCDVLMKYIDNFTQQCEDTNLLLSGKI